MNALRDWFLGLSTTARGWLMAAGAIVVVGLASFVWIAGGPGPMDFARGTKVALSDYRGADPTGVPASLKNESLVKRGEYLARAADCMVCHTAKGGTPYAGGFAFALPFGTIWSTNITPDADTGIGNYSDAQFLAALHRGVRRDGARLYPAMPFASYTYMTDADGLAIKAFLFSLQPVRAPAKKNTLSFPFNQRRVLGLWSAFFNADARFSPNETQTPQWNRGSYIAEALAHCGECHTPRNIAYALNNRRKFAGETTGGWRAYNISADKSSGVGAWSDDQLFAYLTAGHAEGHGTASGPMGEAVDESFSALTPEDMHAVVDYVRSVPAVASHFPAALAPPAPVSPKLGTTVADARGKMVFEGACASCHGWSGISPIQPIATLTGARAVNDPTATNVAQIVISGMVRRTASGTVTMPAFGNAYSNAEIAAVANYVTARFGSTASKISERQVSQLRAASKQ